MAGIGFELRKLFDQKGIGNKLRAYTYTSVVVAGPMLLGVTFLSAVEGIGTAYGMDQGARDLLVSMITYSMLGSLVLTSLVSMPLTRYVSDTLYEGRLELVLPSLEGSLAVVLPLGLVVASVFQALAGQPLLTCLLNVMLFGELSCVWITTSYLTAIKDYRNLLLGYLGSIAVAIVVGWAACAWLGPTINLLLAAVVLGYGIMAVFGFSILYRYFPHGHDHYLLWLSWVSHYKSLVVTGVCTYVGLFSFIVVSWLGPDSIGLAPLYRACPAHDVPAFFAFFTVLVMQVTFVASTEVNFYPVYRRYYDLYNTDGSITEIDNAQEEMFVVLDRELGDLARKQLLASALAVSVGSVVLVQLPLGFSVEMQAYFITLCLAYCAYAIGNTVTLMDLYFTDNRGAAISASLFAVVTTVGSVLALRLPSACYGIGFVAGSYVYLFSAWLQLYRFTRNLPYTILSSQPFIAEEGHGLLERLSRLA